MVIDLGHRSVRRGVSRGFRWTSLPGKKDSRAQPLLFGKRCTTPGSFTALQQLFYCVWNSCPDHDSDTLSNLFLLLLWHLHINTFMISTQFLKLWITVLPLREGNYEVATCWWDGSPESQTYALSFVLLRKVVWTQKAVSEQCKAQSCYGSPSWWLWKIVSYALSQLLCSLCGGSNCVAIAVTNCYSLALCV